MSQQKEQAQLIEQVGFGLEERLKLSPLASRIYTLLILSSYEGLTFDDIRETLNASKSATSVNVNVLMQLNYVASYTKPGDRKRYFKLAKYSQVVSLETELQKIDIEMEMVEKINTYNKKYHSDKFVDENTLGNIFEAYLLEKQKLLEGVINKMKHFRESEKQ
ncbi:GbsR/MarR family transcriptional regulator [Gelidibacter salicanalis]|uniref:MarR family transcriptional regulator n=1 Tax=Gelidibacter salicanalis TaxID=291193 RepID=A0A934KNH8_9FLAO|nr:helix-turn-helix domain-containing protein [Gelidibacter salicanalis]MBJ7882517.1 MarR family transcriptional regulator [Gelidibacter salicanalis]